jgi:hypothetical protein
MVNDCAARAIRGELERKLINAAAHGLDVLWILRLIEFCRSQAMGTSTVREFTSPLPDFLENFFVGKHAVAAKDQIFQQLKFFRSQRNAPCADSSGHVSSEATTQLLYADSISTAI